MNKILFITFLICSFHSLFGQPSNKRLLLVLDIQENLINPKSRIHIDTTSVDLFFENVNYTISNFKSNGDLIVYIVNEWENPIQNWMTGNVCKKGGFGVGLDKRLLIVSDKVFSKSKSNSLSNMDLLKLINDNQVGDIYIVGLLAEGCVKATAKGIKVKKINVTIVEDALGSKSLSNKIKTIDYFKKNNIKTIKTKSI